MTKEELERQLRKLVVGCPGEEGGETDDSCSFCHCPGSNDMAKIMGLVDIYTEVLLATRRNVDDVEAWDASRVAGYLDLKDENGARSTMSRGQITIIKKTNPTTGRMTSYYVASEVRALRQARKAAR